MGKEHTVDDIWLGSWNKRKHSLGRKQQEDISSSDKGRDVGRYMAKMACPQGLTSGRCVCVYVWCLYTYTARGWIGSLQNSYKKGNFGQRDLLRENFAHVNLKAEMEECIYKPRNARYCHITMRNKWEAWGIFSLRANERKPPWFHTSGFQSYKPQISVIWDTQFVVLPVSALAN